MLGVQFPPGTPIEEGIFMQYENVIISKSGIEIGDFVLMNKSNGYYGRVVMITKRIYDKNDWYVKYGRHGKKKINAGDEAASTLTVVKIINMDLSQPKRKSKTSIDDDKAIRITKEFISKMFKKLNDTLAMVRMTNEQEGIT